MTERDIHLIVQTLLDRENVEIDNRKVKNIEISSGEVIIRFEEEEQLQ